MHFLQLQWVRLLLLVKAGLVRGGSVTTSHLFPFPFSVSFPLGFVIHEGNEGLKCRLKPWQNVLAPFQHPSGWAKRLWSASQNSMGMETTWGSCWNAASDAVDLEVCLSDELPGLPMLLVWDPTVTRKASKDVNTLPQKHSLDWFLEMEVAQ